MKKVTKSPLVMDVLNIQGVQRSLERLADLLGKIQKALGEYLERERSSFPRYDQLLLEHRERLLEECPAVFFTSLLRLHVMSIGSCTPDH